MSRHNRFHFPPTLPLTIILDKSYNFFVQYFRSFHWKFQLLCFAQTFDLYLCVHLCDTWYRRYDYIPEKRWTNTFCSSLLFICWFNALVRGVQGPWRHCIEGLRAGWLLGATTTKGAIKPSNQLAGVMQIGCEIFANIELQHRSRWDETA